MNERMKGYTKRYIEDEECSEVLRVIAPDRGIELINQCAAEDAKIIVLMKPTHGEERKAGGYNR